MKAKTKRRIKGSITILMVIIMLPMMTLSAIIVDSSRINMTKSMISSAGDLTMNSALANYDTILKDVYGLFAMSQNKSDDELAEELRSYFADTLVSYGVVSEAESGQYVDALIGDFKEIISSSGGKTSNFLSMEVDKSNFTAEKVDESSLANPDIMRTQIVEYMKYRAPINFGMSFLDSIKAFTSIEDQTKVVEKQVAAQESTQDVTSACSKLIASIRDYDDLINSINTDKGEKAVKGDKNPDDEVFVGIGNYHLQFPKYKDTWGNNSNYKYINKLNLVFMANAPSTSDMYLSGLDYRTTEHFIERDSTGLTGLIDSHGVSVSVDLADTYETSQTQFNNQISKLNKTDGAEYKTSAEYAKKDYLSYKNISKDYKTFVDEEKAISAFVDYKKFMTDDKSVTLKYSDVKSAIEELVKLDNYYNNYIAKLNVVIEEAEKAYNTAKQNADTVAGNADIYAGEVSKYVTSINNRNSNFSGNYDFLSGVKNDSNQDLKEKVDAYRAETAFAMPGTIYICDRNFYNFNGYSFKESIYDSDDRYLKLFKQIIRSSVSSKSEYSLICAHSRNYLANSENQSYANYVLNKINDEVLSDDEVRNNKLFVLLNYLNDNHECVKYIDKNIALHDQLFASDNTSNYTKLREIEAEKKEEWDEKKTEKDNAIKAYGKCLVNYQSFADSYETDIFYYNRYIEVAENVAGIKATKINEQFNKIKSNVDAIIKQFESIETNLSDTKIAIEEYNKKLEDWAGAAENYKDSQSQDNFHKTNVADIETAKSQYDLNSLATLTTYVGSLKAEYQDFYNDITNASKYKYGTTRIDTITTADQLKSAVSDIKSSLPSVVDVKTADGKFDSLYTTTTTPPTIGADSGYQYCFLEPRPLPIQFLKYLNSAFPEKTETESSGSGSGGKSEESSESSAETDYENTKDKLNKESGKEVKDDTDENKYGYVYKSRDADSSGLPSNGYGEKSVTNQTLKVTEDSEGKVNASDSMSSQSSSLSSILNGIGSVANTAVENLYILTYIFENFSYNTLIQDIVMKDFEYENVGTALVKSNELLTPGQKSLDSILGTSQTLSNFPKNKDNNYLYGGEIEYILYGSKDAAKNVTLAKASIFAIRFAFNCIYAFTNSEIRNTTMAAGLAVQAATLGIVPYQVVQIVLQLAMAAGESAFDMSLMNNGVKVAIVKSSETWALSVKNALQTAGDLAAGVVEKAATNAIQSISGGLQSLVDATAEELEGSIGELTDSLSSSAKTKVEEITDSAFMYIQTEIENALNSLQFIDEKKDLNNEVEVVFSNLETTITSGLKDKFKDNELAKSVIGKITPTIKGILTDVKDNINSALSLPGDPNTLIVEQMTEIKTKLLLKVNAVIDDISQELKSVTTDLTNEMSEKLNGFIEEKGEKLSEEAAKAVKENVTNATNDFISKYLDDGKSASIGTGTTNTGGKNTSIASFFKFGYKDYMMLFTYIAIAVNDSAILCRTADIIQMNLSKATDNSSFKHAKGGDFKMSDAKTYISINASVKLDMLFMNMDFFSDVVTDGGTTDVEGQLTNGATIKYKGLYGY